jgi:catechol 2,3-dioxygenase-like lactoylglutathione lyase family enzyme
MIGYVTLGTNNLAAAAVFYDQLLGEINAMRIWEYERGIGWGVSEDTPSLSVVKPYDGNVANFGNGVMVALVVDTQEKVNQMYNKALALGAKDEGAPGFRSDTFYAGYFRDLDDNKLCIYYEPT